MRFGLDLETQLFLPPGLAESRNAGYWQKFLDETIPGVVKKHGYYPFFKDYTGLTLPILPAESFQKGELGYRNVDNSTPMSQRTNGIGRRALSYVVDAIAMLAVLLPYSAGNAHASDSNPTPRTANSTPSTVNLVPGWNFTPYNGNGGPVDDALSNCLSAVDAVFNWDSANQRYKWWFKNSPPAVNNLTAVNRGDVLLLQANKECNWAQPVVNALLSYNGNLPKQVYDIMSPLGEDGVLDADEQAAVKFAIWVANGMVPKDRTVYYTPKELEVYQTNLAKSFMGDGRVSQHEAMVMRTLMDTSKWSRWWIVRNVVNSGMIGEAYFFRDTDGDGIRNIDELLQGTDPLHKLETKPNEPSKRYAIVISGAGLSRDDNTSQLGALFFYHELMKAGYEDKDIQLLLPTQHLQNPNNLAFSPLDWRSWWDTNSDLYRWLGKNLFELAPVEADYKDWDVTAEAVNNAFTSIQSKIDNNDTLTVYMTGHGYGSERPGDNVFWLNWKTIRGVNPTTGRIDGDPIRITSREIVAGLNKFSYGGAVVFDNSSRSEALIRDLGLGPLGNTTVGVASSYVKDPAGHSGWGQWLIDRLAMGLPLLDAGRRLQNDFPGMDMPFIDRYYEPSSELAKELAKVYNPFY